MRPPRFERVEAGSAQGRRPNSHTKKEEQISAKKIQMGQLFTFS